MTVSKNKVQKDDIRQNSHEEIGCIHASNDQLEGIIEGKILKSNENDKILINLIKPMKDFNKSNLNTTGKQKQKLNKETHHVIGEKN